MRRERTKREKNDDGGIEGKGKERKGGSEKEREQDRMQERKRKDDKGSL